MTTFSIIPYTYSFLKRDKLNRKIPPEALIKFWLVSEPRKMAVKLDLDTITS